MEHMLSVFVMGAVLCVLAGVVLTASGGATMPGPTRIYEDFRFEPVTSKYLGGAVTGTAADRNVALFSGYGLKPSSGFEWVVIGTQTILAPKRTATGWDINQDQTSGDGIELMHGLVAAGLPISYVVGTDGAFYFKVRVKVGDASGANPLMMGFKKVEAFQTDWNDYDELASIGIHGTANPNTIKLQTILNNAATVATDTTQTWADAATKTLSIFVSAAGVVTYQIEGAAPTVTAAFTFDSGEVVMPFFRFLNAADVADAVELVSWDCGLQ